MGGIVQKFIVLVFLIFNLDAFGQMGSDTRLGKFDQLDTNSELVIELLKDIEAMTNGAWLLPVGTEAQRPATPANGMIRYNSDAETFEGYADGEWGPIAGGGGGLDKWDDAGGIEYVEDQVIWEPLSLKIYVANTTHTSTATFQDDIANWTELSNPFDATNLAIAGNTLSVTDTDGDLILGPNGEGDLLVKYGANELNLDPQNTNSILSNGSFERGVQGTCTNCTLDVSTSEVESGVENNFQSLEITITDADAEFELPLNITGIEAGRSYTYTINIKTALDDITVCEKVDTVVRNCLEVPMADKWGTITFIGVIGATSNSIVVKSETATSGVVYVDRVRALLAEPNFSPSRNCFGTLDCENTFSGFYDAAEGTLSAAVKNQTPSQWITNTAKSGGGNRTKTFTVPSGVFSVVPNCTATASTGSGRVVEFESGDASASTPTSLVFRTGDAGFGSTDASFRIDCTKGEGDFKTTNQRGILETGNQAGGALVQAVVDGGQSVGTTDTVFALASADINEIDGFTFDESTNVFTATQSGTYNVSLVASLTNTTNNQTTDSFVEVNTGAGFMQRDSCGDARNVTTVAAISKLVCIDRFRLSKGDELRIVLNSSAAGTTLNSLTASHLQIRSVLDREYVKAELAGVMKSPLESNKKGLKLCIISQTSSTGTSAFSSPNGCWGGTGSLGSTGQYNGINFAEGYFKDGVEAFCRVEPIATSNQALWGNIYSGRVTTDSSFDVTIWERTGTTSSGQANRGFDVFCYAEGL
jgi:hypothetical protein